MPRIFDIKKIGNTFENEFKYIENNENISGKKVMGGSWKGNDCTKEKDCNMESDYYGFPNQKYDNYGFRIVRTI